jgi:protein gp37
MNNVKNSIGWADFTWNPAVGCKRGCPYCYAKKIYQRFNTDKFEDMHYYDVRLKEPYKIKKPSKIFVGSMSDICYWTVEYTNKIIQVAKENPQHTFMFLTKDGTIYEKYRFPKNCWLGITYTEHWRMSYHGSDKNIKFMSIEPLLKYLDIMDIGDQFDWYIIGGLSPKIAHKAKWVDSLIETVKKYNTPIFLKSNLKYDRVIKQFPSEVNK